jgi:hypothetical protein
MVVRIHPREPSIMTRAAPLLSTLLLIGTMTGCKKADEAPGATTGAEVAAKGLECDHDLKSNALVKHSWPYPAHYRNLRWGSQYQKVRLKLRPTRAAFVTATVTWKEGDIIEVLDSQVQIIKPRRLVAKRDLFVKRKVWSQGIQVERTFLAAAKGEVGSFLFYNSEGLCMVGTDDGPGWTPCTLDDAFEGLSAENAQACEQVWWVQVQKRKIDKGWMVVDTALMERVAPLEDAAR